MNALVFSGGVHPPEHKDMTQTEYIETLETPKKVVVPLSMHIGAPAKALVKKGDEVRTGQKIGQSDSFITAAIHSPITGVVKSIDTEPHPVFGQMQAVTIEGDGTDIFDFEAPEKAWNDMTSKEIIGIVKEAGIVGMGGAAFPTHVKLSPPKGKSVETLIINGAECEPYLTSDDRVMQEMTDEMIEGIEILKYATGASEVIIAIEDNKHLASKAVDRAIEKSETKSSLKKMILHTRYPQGSEKQLIYALTGKEVPSGGLPIDVGVVVQNVGTAKAVYDAVTKGKPLYERVITVTGDGVNKPGNFLARIGMTFGDLINAASGFRGDTGKVINGGPMMGIAQYTVDTPVIKGTSGILVLQKHSVETPEPENCIRCSFCINACPQRLMPQVLAKLAKKEMWSKMKYEYNMMDCMECGCCTYICPSRIPLVQWIRLGKFKTRMLKI